MRNKAKSEWTIQFQKLKDSLVRAAKVVFEDGEEYHKHVRSGTKTTSYRPYANMAAAN